MKKFLKSQIKKILTISSNRKGITSDKIKEYLPYEINKENIEILLNEDKEIMKKELESKENNKEYIYLLTEEYTKSKKFENIERKLYNLDYLSSLFKEIEIIIIYKLIKGHDKITYQQIVNYLSSLYNLKKDIKQVSHYSLILLKLNQILSYQPGTVEKFNKVNIIGNSYLKFHKEANNECINNTINESEYNSLNIVQKMTKAFIIDESEIKNSIMFHLYLNKEKEGVSANELFISCDFIRRGKVLNKVITYMENESSIAHKALRKGKIMKFLYYITDENKVSPRIKFLANYFKKILAQYSSNKTEKNIEKENNIKDVIKESRNESCKSEIISLNEDDMNNRENSIDKNMSLKSEILNQEDYNFILSKMKELNKKIIKEEDDNHSMRKNIINYISSIEKNKNVSLSSYNRYIFILNILYEKKVLSFVEIKHHISNDLEKNKEFMIDRKTIRRLLNTLEKIGLIKIVRYELTMRNLIHKYLNSKEEIKQEKIIVVHRDVDINNKIFHHQANEKLRNNKKNENKFNFNVDEIKKIKENKNNNINQLINSVIDNNNDKIKINLIEKLFIPLYNILQKIVAKNKIDIKKAFNEFIQRLKKNFINSNYVNNLFNKKNKEIDIINKFKNDNLVENFYEKNNFTYSNIIKKESQLYSNIIIPEYIKEKFIHESQNVFIQNSEEDQEDDIIFNNFENPLFSIKSKYYLDGLNYPSMEEEKSEIDYEKKFIEKKRFRFTKLKDNSLDNKNMNRIVAINDILDIIGNLPGITIKSLRKMLNVNSQCFCIEKNIIIYMINLGLIYAQDFDEKNCEVIDDTKLFPYSDINLYI